MQALKFFEFFFKTYFRAYFRQGMSRIFSWFFKLLINFFGLFLRSANFIFRALPEHYKDPLMTTFFCAACKFCNKKTGQKAVFARFLETFDQKIALGQQLFKIYYL